ncbi:MAG: hypothetical protein AAB215_00930 [Planctomycetota bacterium]
MRIFFSTVVRDAPPDRGGEIVRMDWETGRVEARAPVRAMDPDPGDRAVGSSTRGGRGVRILGSGICVASYHTLHFLGPDLAPRRAILHSLLAGVHETWTDGDGTIWAACTALDAVVRLDLADGRLVEAFWPCENPAVQRAFGVVPMEIDKSGDCRVSTVRDRTLKKNRLHLNAVAPWRDAMLALCSRPGAVIDLRTGDVRLRDEALKGAHNLVVLPDGTALVNDTARRAILFYDLPSARLVRRIDLMAVPDIRSLVRRCSAAYAIRRALAAVGMFRGNPPRPLFVRGLALEKDRLFVGISPAAILCFEFPGGRFLGLRPYSWDVRTTMHGLAVGEGA